MLNVALRAHRRPVAVASKCQARAGLPDDQIVEGGRAVRVRGLRIRAAVKHAAVQGQRHRDAALRHRVAGRVLNLHHHVRHCRSGRRVRRLRGEPQAHSIVDGVNVTVAVCVIGVPSIVTEIVLISATVDSQCRGRLPVGVGRRRWLHQDVVRACRGHHDVRRRDPRHHSAFRVLGGHRDGRRRRSVRHQVVGLAEIVELAALTGATLVGDDGCGPVIEAAAAEGRRRRSTRPWC